MNRSLLIFYATIAAFLLLASCDHKKQGGNEEGSIHFQTTPTNKADPLFDLAPSEATLNFKGDKFRMDMSVMGVFKTSLIGDSKAKTMAHTVKFMNIKQYCIEDEKKLSEENNNYPLKLEETNETRMIAGLKCYRIKVKKLNEGGESFDAWYTRDLGMENCNALTSYAPIKGVLVDYRIRKMGLEMHFTATAYKNEKVPDNTFDIPASLKQVSTEEMSKVFTEL